MLNKEKLSFDERSGTWRLNEHRSIPYSEGKASELYLERVFKAVKDLSSNSYELETWIKDWSTEYHLSRKRSQLLRGFEFDRSKRVLEVGAGCGAMTRILGEKFDSVTSVEGNEGRAKLARLRTRDLDSVVVVSAPFQEVEFTEKFDIIFCIGVLEYSGSFIEGTDDPYDFALQYFSSLLAEDGMLVLAIENQFGLKYFAGCREDHTASMFDGLEGYLKTPGKVRTFGYTEIQQRLQKYFPRNEFYFPYPDYKMPLCVVSQELVSKKQIGELLGKFRSKDYTRALWQTGPDRHLDERFILPELARNDMIPFFANSFLIVSSKNADSTANLGGLGVFYSASRPAKFQTVTKILEPENGKIIVEKTLVSGRTEETAGFLRNSNCRETWQDGQSVGFLALRCLGKRDIQPSDLAEPLSHWLKFLNSVALSEDDPAMVDGKFFDCIPRNLILSSNGECTFIDQEWSWTKPIIRNAVVIRGLYYLLYDCSGRGDAVTWKSFGSTKSQITSIAGELGVELKKSDFEDFYVLEKELLAAFGTGRKSHVKFLTECPAPDLLRALKHAIIGGRDLFFAALKKARRTLSG